MNRIGALARPAGLQAVRVASQRKFAAETRTAPFSSIKQFRAVSTAFTSQHRAVLQPAVLATGVAEAGNSAARLPQQHHNLARITKVGHGAGLGTSQRLFNRSSKPVTLPRSSTRGFHNSAPARQMGGWQPGPGGPPPVIAAIVMAIFTVLLLGLAITFSTVLFSIFLAFWPLFLVGLGVFWLVRLRRGAGAGGAVPGMGGWPTAGPGGVAGPFAPGVPNAPFSGLFGRLMANMAQSAATMATAEMRQAARMQAALRASAGRALSDSETVRAELARHGISGDRLAVGNPFEVSISTVAGVGAIGPAVAAKGPRSTVTMWAPVMDHHGNQVAAIRMVVRPELFESRLHQRRRSLRSHGPGHHDPADDVPGAGPLAGIRRAWHTAVTNANDVFQAAREGRAGPTDAYIQGTRHGSSSWASGSDLGRAAPGTAPQHDEEEEDERFTFNVDSAVLTTPSGRALDLTQEWALGWVSKAGEAHVPDGSPGGQAGPFAATWPGGAGTGNTGPVMDLDKSRYRTYPEGTGSGPEEPVRSSRAAGEEPGQGDHEHHEEERRREAAIRDRRARLRGLKKGE